jgi:hypothetical protein
MGQGCFAGICVRASARARHDGRQSWQAAGTGTGKLTIVSVAIALVARYRRR